MENIWKTHSQLIQCLSLQTHFTIIDELNTDGSVSKKLSTLYETNHGLNIEDENEFRKLVTENLPPQKNEYQEIRQIIMGNVNPDAEKQNEMEMGPNHCVIR